MNTFKTVNEAREYAKGKDQITHIALIKPGMPEINPYICLTCDIPTIKMVLDRRPMPEIKEVLAVAADLANEKRIERQEKIEKNVPGLAELHNIIDSWDDYQESFSRMMDDEMNDGVNPPQRPLVEVATIAAKYPVASAYIKAEYWELASHYAKSAAGTKAKNRIINGENYKKVISEMEREWSDHTSAHAWD